MQGRESMKEKEKTKILLYHSYLSEMGGTDTFVYNFCYLFHNDYDITLLYCGGKRVRINLLKKLVKLERYSENKTYEMINLFFFHYR